jgi:hypothetical protein
MQFAWFQRTIGEGAALEPDTGKARCPQSAEPCC